MGLNMDMILDLFRLDGQVAVITGGNRGLGLGIATALAQAGANIVSVQRKADAPELIAAVGQAGRNAHMVTLDVGATDAAQQALTATLQRFGRVDILVNNAGVQRRYPSAEFPVEEWDLVLNINMRAVFLFCKAFGRTMLKQGRGKIINITSVLSFQGGYTVPAYAAAKHAVAGLTKSLCNEWGSQGVNVNAIAPGYMDTDMNEALKANVARSAAINARIPAGRWGQPDDIGGVAVFLASRASDYVHGEVITVDGGWMAR